MPPRVVLILRAIPHYRVPFLDLLRADLTARGIRLSVVYGQVGPERATKQDTVVLPWGIKIENRVFAAGQCALYWQPCLEFVRDTDLVIVTQEAKLMANYVLHWRRARGRIRMAYWGHGGTYQRGTLTFLVQPVKAWLARQVDWWFAYTSRSADSLAEMGVLTSRVTVVNNAIDTDSLVKSRVSMTSEQLYRERLRLGVHGQRVAAFVGGMYREKRLDFIVKACEVARAQKPDLEVLFIGDGPESWKVKEAAATRPWVHYLGAQFGAEKVAALALAKVLLMPGAVGLAVLDSFALEIPILTTGAPSHGPEIDYLQNDGNGVILPESSTAEQYGVQLAALISDDDRLGALREGCRVAAGKYTIEDMASRFAAGVVQALQWTSPGGGGPWSTEAGTGSPMSVSDS